MKLTLHRLYLSEATLGVLELENGQRFWTLEDVAGEGENHCIAEGAYRLERHSGARWKRTWAIVGPGVAHWPTRELGDRETVLVHIGNDVDDTTGCVLVGMAAEISGLRRPEVYASGVAFTALLRALEGEGTHELLIQRG